MAYVTVNWEYGDTSNIVGFRIYRDGVLRADINDVAIRTYDDDITGFTPLRATYSVVAYDSLNRESANCSTTTVELTYLLTPTMTANNLPSGNVTTELSGITVGFQGDSWKYFDADTTSTSNRITNFSANTGVFSVETTYTFDNVVSVDRMGLSFANAGDDTLAYANQRTMELYGWNTGNAKTLLGTIDVSAIHVTGDLAFTDLASTATYNNFSFKFSADIIQVNGTLPISLYNELYIMGRPS